jgi:hypothetical protein
MTIVSETNVHDALAYLAIDPHPLALARKDVTDAENLAKECFAFALIDAEGSVAVREATATTDRAVMSAKARESEAILDLERHKARVKAAEMLIEVWRTENANIRAAERVR